MNRKSFLKQAGLLTAGSFFTPAFFKLLKQNGPFYPLRNGVGYFTGRGGTIGWHITSESVVVIDSQFENSAQSFLSGIFDFGEGGAARYLFNTHHHGDHVSGNQVFLSDNFEIIAHENVPDLQRASSNGQIMVAASRTFSDELSVTSGNENVTARHYGPGHTGGDSVIWFENANIAHMGDLIFNRWYPFIDIEGGASIANWINREFGVSGNRGDVLYMRDYLSKLLEYTRQGLQERRSLEELTQIDQFDEFPNHQSAGSRLSLQSNIEAAYAELTSE
jgi:glyoxylase-like metal-dependent hydrolase (beta-lactamase superfamily II)